MFYLVDDTNRTEITADECAELQQHLEWIRNREDDLEYIRAVRDALASNQGCTTPAEHFIEALLRRYVVLGRKLKPSDIEIDLELFRDEFETLIEGAQYAAQRYPEMLEAKGQQA